ncbi:hypothetical protein FSARC_15051, partial [Fusarium sarcochroum]
EDEEEEEMEQQRQVLQELNARTWSQESKEEQKEEVKETDKVEPVPEPVSHTHDIKGDVDDDLVADGFFFQEAPSPKHQHITITPHFSPTSKPRSAVDKWAALGERRRGQPTTLDSIKSVDFTKPRRHNFGFGYNKSYEAGVWDHSNYHHKFGAAKERSNSKECPWNKGRDWNWRRDRRTDLGDVEWVGGW